MTIDRFLRDNPTKAIVLRSDKSGRIFACVTPEDRPHLILANAISWSPNVAYELAIHRFNESEARKQEVCS